MAQNKVMAADPIKEEDGVKIGFIIKKNRFSGKNNPFTKGNYYATYAHGIDSVVPMPQMLLNAGVMRQAGAWWYYEDENGNPITIDGIVGKFKSKNEFVDTLRSNEAWYSEMISKLKFSENQSNEEIAQAEVENREINTAMNEIERQEAALDINDVLEFNE